MIKYSDKHSIYKPLASIAVLVSKEAKISENS